jgi:hypothetical protein
MAVAGVTARPVPGSPPRVELTNAGERAVTAWAFDVVSQNPNGGQHRETHSADVYLADLTGNLPNAQPHLKWIHRGESMQVPVDALPAGARIDVTAMVFDDGTSEGDQATIDKWFAQRRLERDELRRVSDAFASVLQDQKGTAALEALQQRLAGAAQSDVSVPVRTARDAVATFLQQAKAGQSVDGAVAEYAAFVKRQYDVAVKHAEPKR